MRKKDELKVDLNIYIDNIEEYKEQLFNKLVFIKTLNEDVVFAIKNFSSDVFYTIERFNNIFKTKEIYHYDINYSIVYNMNQFVISYLGIEEDIDKLTNNHTYPLKTLYYDYFYINYSEKKIYIHYDEFNDMYKNSLSKMEEQLKVKQKDDYMYETYKIWRKETLLRNKKEHSYYLYLTNLIFTLLHEKPSKELYEKLKKSHFNSINSINKTIENDKEIIQKVNLSKEKYLQKLIDFGKEFDYEICITKYEE